MTIGEVRKQWSTLLPELTRSLTQGTYRPDPVRQATIPKGKTGNRKLGIPNVIDRVIQEAVRREIEPLFEPRFHPNSHGFRLGPELPYGNPRRRTVLERRCRVGG